MWKMQNCFKLLAIFLIVMLPSFSVAQANVLGNEDALKKGPIAKAIFDINLTSPDKLNLYLEVIKKTHNDLVGQGFDPDFIIAFRGPSVLLLNKNLEQFDEKQKSMLARVLAQISELKHRGVRFEACSVATGLFNVKNSDVLPEVKVVGNTFISLIGYQNDGYSIVPIM